MHNTVQSRYVLRLGSHLCNRRGKPSKMAVITPIHQLLEATSVFTDEILLETTNQTPVACKIRNYLLPGYWTFTSPPSSCLNICLELYHFRLSTRLHFRPPFVIFHCHKTGVPFPWRCEYGVERAAYCWIFKGADRQSGLYGKSL